MTLLGLNHFSKDYVYRCLRPDERSDTDLVALKPNSNYSIEDHIVRGLRFPSQFISTTADETKAAQWGPVADIKTRKEYPNGTRNIIVRIDVNYLKKYHKNLTDKAYDFTNLDVKKKYLSARKAHFFVKSMYEVVFESYIPKEALSIKINGNWTPIAPKKNDTLSIDLNSTSHIASYVTNRYTEVTKPMLNSTTTSNVTPSSINTTTTISNATSSTPNDITATSKDITTTPGATIPRIYATTNVTMLPFLPTLTKTSNLTFNTSDNKIRNYFKTDQKVSNAYTHLLTSKNNYNFPNTSSNATKIASNSPTTNFFNYLLTPQFITPFPNAGRIKRAEKN